MFHIDIIPCLASMKNKHVALSPISYEIVSEFFNEHFLSKEMAVNLFG